MTNEEFLREMQKGTPVAPDTSLARKLEELSWNARWATNYLNCVPHRPHIVRDILSELTGRDVPDDVRLHPPLLVQIGLGIQLGRGVFVDQDVHLLDLGGIRLEDGACVNCGVSIVTSLPGEKMRERNVLFPARVVVGEGAWIGPGATILPGVTIGAGAMISPGSLVDGNVKPRTLVEGRPARYVRDL